MCTGPGELPAIDDEVLLSDGALLEPALQDLTHAGRVASLGRQRRPGDVWGHAVVGLDTSAEMLDILRRRLQTLPAAVQERVRLCQGDATSCVLEEKFDLMILPAFSISLFHNRQQRLQLLQWVSSHLRDGGTFAFDFIHYSADNCQALDGQVNAAEFPAPDGRVASSYGARFSTDRQSVTWNFYTQLIRPDGERRHYLSASQLACIHADEMAELLTAAGLEVTARQRAALPMGNTTAERCFWRCTRRERAAYSLWHPYLPMNHMEETVTVLVRGEGSRVWDREGKEYIDASGGLWSTQCGQGRTEIIDAVAEQMRRLSYGTLFAGRSNEPAMELARTLVELAPAPLSRVYLTGSGSESVELAIKLSRLYFWLQGQPERHRVLFLDQSYHGSFFGSMGVTALFDRKERFAPLLPGLDAVPAPHPAHVPPGMSFDEYALQCAAELERRIESGTVAAFLMEPVLGSAGVVVLPAVYLARVQQICRQHGVLLVLDEVATGFGRTGRWFAAEHQGLRPDLMLLSKGINSGYLPLGAVLFSAEIARVLLDNQSGIGHGSSHNGNPACCAAALAAIGVIRREGLVARAAETGQYFRERLQELHQYPHVAAVRGLGLMLGLELAEGEGSHRRPVSPARLGGIYLAARNRGVLTYPFPSGLSFFPALTISRDEIDVIMDVLHRSLAETSGGWQHATA